MRRPLIVGAALGIALAALPLMGRAATSPSVTLLSPTSGEITGGGVAIRWSYAGFYRTTPIDIEVSKPGGSWVRVTRVAIDDGTPGYFGSATWATTSVDDANDWTVRIIVPTNKSVTSSVSPVMVDNTGPVVTIDNQPAAEGTPAVAALSVKGTAVDAGAGVASVAVTFTSGNGTVAGTVDATCDDDTCSTWSASTNGLTPGRYDVSAVGTDKRGNVGDAASVDAVVIGVPDTPTVDPQPVIDAANGVVGTVTDIVGTVDPEPIVDEVTGIPGTVDPQPVVDAANDVVGTVMDTVGSVEPPA